MTDVLCRQAATRLQLHHVIIPNLVKTAEKETGLIYTFISSYEAFSSLQEFIINIFCFNLI